MSATRTRVYTGRRIGEFTHGCPTIRPVATMGNQRWISASENTHIAPNPPTFLHHQPTTCTLFSPPGQDGLYRPVFQCLPRVPSLSAPARTDPPTALTAAPVPLLRQGLCPCRYCAEACKDVPPQRQPISPTTGQTWSQAESLRSMLPYQGPVRWENAMWPLRLTTPRLHF